MVKGVRSLTALLISILIVISLTLTGCNPRQFKTDRTPRLVLSTLTDPATFNYANNQSFPNIFLFCYEGLTHENGQTGEIEPALAEDWTLSPDQKTLVFTLRPGLRWSDGQPLTADDVVFTYRDILFNPAIPIDNRDSVKIGSAGALPTVRKLDDRSVEFTFPEPFAPFLTATAAPEGMMILPKHALESTLRTKDKDGNLKFLSTWGTDTDPRQIVTNGPYVMESYTAGQRLMFRRNPHYWKHNAQGQALPNIDRIIWQFIENTDTQLLRFRSGDLDVMGDARPMRPEYYALLRREEQRGRFTIQSGGAWSGILYLAFNLNRGQNQAGKPFVDPIKSRWFNTLEFRQAVAYALDRERINTNIFRGLGNIQNSPISVQSPYFATEGLKVYDYNVAKAKQLLQSAGFKYDAQGQLFDGAGHRVEFTLLSNAGNKVREAIGAQMIQDLAAIGMKVAFRPINFNTLSEKISGNRDWEAHMIGFTGGVEPNGLANFWTSSGGSHYFNLKQQPGQKPMTGWQQNDWEGEIDRLFIAGAREFDPVKRKQIYAQFQRLTQEQLPIILLVNDSALMAVRDRVKGLKYSGLPSWGLWNIEELTLED
jgi:peptide/nickel transport system substrate-binding protein